MRRARRNRIGRHGGGIERLTHALHHVRFAFDTNLTDNFPSLHGTRRGPFNSTPVAVNPSSPAHLHVRPMGRMCVDELAKPGKIPTRIVLSLFFGGRSQPVGVVRPFAAETPRLHGRHASWAAQFHPNGGEFEFIWLSTRMPHGAYVWCLTAKQNHEKYPPEEWYCSCSWEGGANVTYWQKGPAAGLTEARATGRSILPPWAMGGQSECVWLSARTMHPHEAYGW